MKGLVAVGIILIAYIIMALYKFSEKNVRRSVVETWMLIYVAILLIMAVIVIKGWKNNNGNLSTLLTSFLDQQY